MGRVKALMKDKAFGFIERNCGRADVSLQFSRLADTAPADLAVGTMVEFSIFHDPRSGRAQATSLSRMKDTGSDHASAQPVRWDGRERGVAGSGRGRPTTKPLESRNSSAFGGEMISSAQPTCGEAISGRLSARWSLLREIPSSSRPSAQGAHQNGG